MTRPLVVLHRLVVPSTHCERAGQVALQLTYRTPEQPPRERVVFLEQAASTPAQDLVAITQDWDRLCANAQAGG